MDSSQGENIVKRDLILRVLLMATDGGLERLHRQMQVLQVLTEVLPRALDTEAITSIVADIMAGAVVRG